MRVLVIGGTGFISAPVVERLLMRGHDVTVVHRGEHEPSALSAASHIHAERRELPEHIGEIQAFRPDVALEMGAMTAVDAESTLQVARKVARRVAAISSADVYRAYGRMHGSEPGPPEPVPIAEDAPLRERPYPYRGEFGGRFDDYDKIPVERVFAAETRVQCTILRLPAVYGERDGQHRLRAELVRMDAGRRAILLPERARTWRWSRSYVGDVADAIALAVSDERAAGRVYNIAPSEAPSQQEWVRVIGEAAGWLGEIIGIADDRLPAHLRMPVNFEQDLVLDSRRIRDELGFKEPHTLAEGVRRTVAWERMVRAPDAFARLQPEFDAEDEILRG